MLFVVCKLNCASSVGLADCSFYRACNVVGIEIHLTVYISRSTSDNLYERSIRTKESFFVRIKDTDEGNLR